MTETEKQTINQGALAAGKTAEEPDTGAAEANIEMSRRFKVDPDGQQDHYLLADDLRNGS